MGNINSSLQNAWQGFFYSLAGSGAITKKQAVIAAGLIDKSVGKGGVTVLTGATTLTAADSGKTFHLHSATGFATTLPALEAGLRFEFYVTTVPTSGNHTIITPASANTIQGTVSQPTGGVVATEAADTITMTQGTANLGDKVVAYCDGVNWSVQAFATANGSLTITQAT